MFKLYLTSGNKAKRKVTEFKLLNGMGIYTVYIYYTYVIMIYHVLLYMLISVE